MYLYLTLISPVIPHNELLLFIKFQSITSYAHPFQLQSKKSANGWKQFVLNGCSTIEGWNWRIFARWSIKGWFIRWLLYQDNRYYKMQYKKFFSRRVYQSLEMHLLVLCWSYLTESWSSDIISALPAFESIATWSTQAPWRICKSHNGRWVVLRRNHRKSNIKTTMAYAKRQCVTALRMQRYLGKNP